MAVDGLHPCPSGHEAVADPRLGEQVARARRIGFELAAQLGHVDPQVVRLGLILRAPDLSEQLAPGDQPAGVAGEQLEQLPFGGGEPDVVAGGERDPLGGEVDGEVVGRDDGLVRARAPPGEAPPAAGRAARPCRTVW